MAERNAKTKFKPLCNILYMYKNRSSRTKFELDLSYLKKKLFTNYFKSIFSKDKTEKS